MKFTSNGKAVEKMTLEGITLEVDPHRLIEVLKGFIKETGSRKTKQKPVTLRVLNDGENNILQVEAINREGHKMKATFAVGIQSSFGGGGFSHIAGESKKSHTNS